MRGPAGKILPAAGLLAACLLVSCSATSDNAGSGEAAADAPKRSWFWELFETSSTEQPLHIGASGKVCSAPLFESAPAPANEDGTYPVDYCKELVIVDPVVLERLQHVSFREVMQAISGKTDTANSRALSDYVETWAGLWQSPQSVDGVGVEPRSDVYDDVMAAWNSENSKDIVLIAVVNRMDLRAPHPEGRLVYQVHGYENGTYLAREMTIILEYRLPPLQAAGQSHLEYWASAWHALGSPDLDLGTYVGKLQTVVDGFNKPTFLNRIRTNEDLGGDWELRQFEVKNGRLEHALLNRTPAELHRTSASHRGDLYRLIATPPISGNLEAGKFEFMDSAEWRKLMGLNSRFTSTPPAWVDYKTNDHVFLMSFNTCNGCHHDVLKNGGGNTHLRRVNPREPATLSNFLSGQVLTARALPDCRTVFPQPGCALGMDDTWNERAMRTGFLRRNLPADQKHNSSFWETFTPDRQFNYRYH